MDRGETARKQNQFIVSGFHEKDGDELFNTSVFISPDGKIGKYRKIHLFMNEKQIYGMTVYMVNGCGQQMGRKEMYRGTEVSINLLPKAKVEMVLPDEKAEALIPEIIETIRTGQVGDGKIFVYACEKAYRVRTSESSEQIL